MKVTDIRETQTAELQKQVVELKQELFSLRFQQASGKAENASKMRNLRRDIARILTVLNERKAVSGEEK